MKASDAKPFIGKLVQYNKVGWSFLQYGVVKSTVGRNIILETDALWAPDISNMKLVESEDDIQ